jgi:predicted RNase H-like nuclease (RuvC/YqgF family)
MADENKEVKEAEYLDTSLFNELEAPEPPKEEAKVEAKVEETKTEEKAPEAKPEEKKPTPEDEIKELRSKLAQTEEKLSALSKPKEAEKTEGKIETLDDIYDREFNERPSEAVKRYVKGLKYQEALERDLANTTHIMQEAASGRVPGWEDFKDIAPVIEKLAETNQDMVKPEFGGSIRVVELLGWAARGMISAAKAKSTANAETKKAEDVAKDLGKEKVFMESNNTSAAAPKATSEITPEEFRKLPLSEMEKLLPFME